MGAARREILAGLAAGGVASRVAAQEVTMIVPLPIPWDPEGLADLERRLTTTRWNDAVVSDWSYGMERGFLRNLVAYWRDQYD
jgi:hypothetical protein